MTLDQPTFEEPTFEDSTGELLRALAPQVLGTLVHRYGDFARCEDAVQEALIAAGETWSRSGVPEHPLGWLKTVAARRYIDQVRADGARERRELAALDAMPRDALVAPPPDAEPARDDLLELLFLCCHPALTAASQLALTLRAVGGLTTGEIAAAFLVPEKTMGQRISRAKQRLQEVGARFALPADAELGPRLEIVLHVLYLMFNEGYSASTGTQLRRPDLTLQALHLTRRLHAGLPGSGETAGLLALMLLTEARSEARTGLDGILVPLAEQDRHRWDTVAIAEGAELITRTLATRPLGPYQVQAAIAAVHDEAPSVEATDWPQILALYEILERLAPNPVTTLNRAVALNWSQAYSPATTDCWPCAPICSSGPGRWPPRPRRTGRLLAWPAACPNRGTSSSGPHAARAEAVRISAGRTVRPPKGAGATM